MFCKNCGAECHEGAAICTLCGFAIGTGDHYCQSCGEAVQPGQAVCVKCGTALDNAAGAKVAPKGNKSKLVAGLLGIFLGSLGVHNFYLGKTKRAVIQLLVSLLTCGVGATAMGIWGLVEGILILMSHQGYTTDGQGNTLCD